MFPCNCNVKTTSLRHPAREDSLKDYPAPAYSKVGQPWSKWCFVWSCAH